MSEQDTLAFQLKERPGSIKRDMSDAPTPKVLQALNAYMTALDGNTVKPEKAAIGFYLGNHVVAKIQKEVDEHQPLGALLPLVDKYQTSVSQQATRLFYYLLLICTRETRHIHDFHGLWAKLESKADAACVSFTQSIKGSGSGGAVNKLKKSPPDTSIGTYTNHMVNAFYDGKYSGGYGGKKWGVVAEACRDFVHGTLSAEMMLDVGWTLCHNGGPIFNKGMLYDHYNGHEITKILDCQRAGMIPQLVANAESGNVTAKHKEYQQEAEKLLGPELGGVVDWHWVKEAGALGKYTGGGGTVSKGDIAKKKAALQKKKMEQEMAAIAKKEAEMKKWYVVNVHDKVEKIQVRKHKAA